MNPSNRISLADAETQLGRPCPHVLGSTRTRADYCRRCSNLVAQKRLEQRRVAALDAYTQSRKVSLI